MPYYVSNSVYISLHGAWSSAAYAVAKQAIDAFLHTLNHDGLGEPELEGGRAYAYDADYPSDDALADLIDTLKAGPAWSIRIEEADDLAATTWVSGPGISDTVVFSGSANDPDIPLSKVNDLAHLAEIREAVRICETKLDLVMP